MANSWFEAAADLLRNLFGQVMAGGPPLAEPTTTVGTGRIDEIEAGDGPPWGTLSGLTAHPTDASILYAVTDKNSPPTRIVEIRLSATGAAVTRQIEVEAPGQGDLDCEGVVAKPDGGFWLASEGGKRNAPPNVMIETDASGRMRRAIHLPEPIARRMPKKGFEGIALQQSAAASRLVVAFQAPIDGDPEDLARIGVVDVASGGWTFHGYPLGLSSTGERTGLSDILQLGDARFAAIERDGNGGRSSAKWLTTFELSGAGAAPDHAPPRLSTRRAVDLVPVFIGAGRKVAKEIEGLTVAADGQVYVVTDNDNDGATLLLRLGQANRLF